MAIVYRTAGAWGTGKGANLVPAEVDGNFYDLDGKITYLQENPPEAITPIAINIEAGLFTMDMSDGSTLGPIVMTMPVPQWRGDWAPATPYNEMDFFVAPDGGMGAVMKAHTSAATFDWAALSDGVPVYQEIVGASGTTAGLNDLVDVTITSAGANDLLTYNAAASLWQNHTPAYVATTVLPAFGGDAGSGGTRGMVPAPAAGDAAAGKVLGAGGGWIVPAVGGGGSTSLAGLSDVAISAPANLSLLQYKSADGKWHNETLASLGAGTVTSIATTNGVSGGPITSTGTIQLAPIATATFLANITGSSAAPVSVTLSDALDTIISNARGSLLRRGAAGWTALAPGTAGTYLKSGGSGADVSWDSPSGTGTVTSVASGTGLTGGPITATGTLSLATIASDTMLANISGATAAPSATTLSGLLDHILGSGRGQIIYRGGSTWSALSPGTNGYYLQTRGAGSDPIWSNVKGGGGATSAPSLWHTAADYATAAALPAHTYSNGSAGVGATLTASANGALSIDGAAPTVGQRILVKDETSLVQNGCYTVTAAGSGAAPWVLTRATDYDDPTEVTQGTAFPVTNGAVNDNSAWVMITAGTLVIGTSAIEFDPITATMPIAGSGQVLGNPNSFSAPVLPTSLTLILDRAFSTTHGAILYRSGALWQALAPGTAGQVLTTGGAGAEPAWAAGGGGGGASITTSDTPPGSPADGDAWWDSIGGQLYIWYDDGSSSQWVPASNQPGPQGPAGTNANITGLTSGQLAVAGSATSITSSVALPLPVASGGTSSTTAAAALTALGAVAKVGDTMTGALTVNGNVSAYNHTISTQATGDAGVFGFTNTNGPGIMCWGNTTGNAGALLVTNSGVERMRVANSGGVQIGTPTGGDKGAGTLNATAVYAAGTLLTSDAAFKTDIEALSAPCLPLIAAVEPKTFHWLEPDDPERAGWVDRRHTGFVAQDLADAAAGELPGLIDGKPGEMALDVGAMLAVLWQAVRELSSEVDALKAGAPAPADRRG